MSSSVSDNETFFQLDGNNYEPVTSASLREQIDLLTGQATKIESFHAMFKLNKRILKDLAENIRKQKPGLLKILNIMIPHVKSGEEDCFYMNGIHQVLESTRQMAQYYMRTIDKFEAQLVKQHAALKEEGKLIYQIQKENKEEFKNQKSLFEAMVKKLRESQGKISSQLILDYTLSNKNGSRSQLSDLNGQLVETTQEKFLHIQAISFFHTIKLLRLRAEQCLAKANNLCMESARTIQTIMKEFSLDKLDKCIDPSVINLNVQIYQNLSNQITMSQNFIDQCQISESVKENRSQNTPIRLFQSELLKLPQKPSPVQGVQAFASSKQLSVISKESMSQVSEQDSIVYKLSEKGNSIVPEISNNKEVSEFSLMGQQNKEIIDKSPFISSYPFSSQYSNQKENISQTKEGQLRGKRTYQVNTASVEQSKQKDNKQSKISDKILAHYENNSGQRQQDSEFILKPQNNPSSILREYNGQSRQSQQNLKTTIGLSIQSAQKNNQYSDKKENFNSQNISQY